MRRLGALAAGLGLLVGGACDGGASGTVSATEWAEAVCRGFAGFADRLEEGFEGISGLPENPSGTDEIRAALTSVQNAFVAFDEGAARLDGAIEDAGTPDVEDGERVVRELRQALADTRRLIGDARGVLDDLDPDEASLSDFLEAGEQFREMGEAFDRIPDLDEIGGPELEGAFDRSEACQELEQRFEGFG